MKTAVLTFLALFTLCGVMTAVNAKDAESESKGVLRHVVLFKFKEDLPKEKVDEVVRAFAALPKKIDVIKEFEWGTDVGVENLSQGFTHAFVVTFADAKARDQYLPHPAHKEFVKLIEGRLDGVLVVDYFAKR